MSDRAAPRAVARRDGPVLAVAALAAFASSILAISAHADAVEQGYRLAAARREGEVLLREALRAERHVAILSIPTAVAQRAAAMRLGLEHPRDRRILTRDEVTAILAPPQAAPIANVAPPQAAPVANVAPPAAVLAKPPVARPPEGMSK